MRHSPLTASSDGLFLVFNHNMLNIQHLAKWFPTSHTSWHISAPKMSIFVFHAFGEVEFFLDALLFKSMQSNVL